MSKASDYGCLRKVPEAHRRCDMMFLACRCVSPRSCVYSDSSSSTSTRPLMPLALRNQVQHHNAGGKIFPAVMLWLPAVPPSAVTSSTS